MDSTLSKNTLDVACSVFKKALSAIGEIPGNTPIVLKKFLAGSDKLPSLINPNTGALNPLSLANSAYFF